MSDKETYKGDKFKYKGDNALKLKTIPKGKYRYSFRIYDIFGNSQETDSAAFDMADSNVNFTEEEHLWRAATCTEPQICVICGAKKGKPLGHDLEAANCQHPKKCKRCGKEEGGLGDHKWKDATCTEPKTCEICKKTEGDPLGHDWAPATVKAPKTCKRCGKTEGEKLSYSAYNSVLDNFASEFSSDWGPIYYLYDMDGNGTKELICTCDGMGSGAGSAIVYTLSGNGATELGDFFCPFGEISLYNGKLFAGRGSGGNGGTYLDYVFAYVSGGKLVVETAINDDVPDGVDYFNKYSYIFDNTTSLTPYDVYDRSPLN